MKLFFSVFICGLMLLSFTSCKDGEEEPVEEKPIKTKEDVRCEDACIFALDGECDDGGYGSKTSYCEFGKDCGDCGPRIVVEVID